MTITTKPDYSAAIAKKAHLENLLARGSKQFSGYGLELFQSSVQRNLDRLAAAISEYDARRCFITDTIVSASLQSTYDLCFVVCGGAVLADSSFATTTLGSSALPSGGAWNFAGVGGNIHVSGLVPRQSPRSVTIANSPVLV
jgi:hypothetical protein